MVLFILIVTALFFALKIKNSSLESDLKEEKTKVEIAKDEIETEGFEERWRAIAEEHNKTKEVKKDETVIINDTNGTFTVTF